MDHTTCIYQLMDIFVVSTFSLLCIIYCYEHSCDNFCVHVFSSWVCIPRNEINVYTYPVYILLGHMLTPCLFIWEITRLYSKLITPFYNPINIIWRFLFFHIITNTSYCLSLLTVFFIMVILVGIKVTSHCGFDLHFSDS